LIFQGVLTSSWRSLETFEELTNLFIFATWIFYGLAVVSLFRLRKTEPNMDRPYAARAIPISLESSSPAARSYHQRLFQNPAAPRSALSSFLSACFFRYWQRNQPLL